MSVKRTLFPPQPGQAPHSGNQTPDQDDFFADPDMGGFPGQPHPQEGGAGTPGQDMPNSQKAKGHAAYGAQDDIPPFSPENRGFGAASGLYTDDPAGPVGHGLREDGGAGDILSVVTDDALRAECEKRICPSCQVYKQSEEQRLRALAELDNARKRLERERGEQIRFASEKVLNDILPSLDNLDLALQHANRDACKDFVVGVEMTRKLLQDALAKHGLTKVGEVGEEFNPALHEAVGMNADPNVENGHVCALLGSGYKLNDRLLRPARVMVCKK